MRWIGYRVSMSTRPSAWRRRACPWGVTSRRTWAGGRRAPPRFDLRQGATPPRRPPAPRSAEPPSQALLRRLLPRLGPLLLQGRSLEHLQRDQLARGQDLRRVEVAARVAQPAIGHVGVVVVAQNALHVRDRRRQTRRVLPDCWGNSLGGVAAALGPDADLVELVGARWIAETPDGALQV